MLTVPNAPLTSWFLLAFALSWACWVPAALLTGGAGTTAGHALVIAGGLGPLLATFAVLAPAGQRAARARWWRRLRNVGGLVSPAGVLCVLVPLLVASLALDSWAVSGGVDLPALRPADLAGLAPLLLVGALAGEPGWRGYALPALLRARDPVAPTLALAVAWGLWQLPLFFIKGTYLAGIPLASAAGVLYFVNLAAQSLLMTAFYLATRCTWAAVLFQAVTLFAGEYWQMPVTVELHRTLWTVLLAGVVLVVKPPFGIRIPDGGPR